MRENYFIFAIDFFLNYLFYWFVVFVVHFAVALTLHGPNSFLRRFSGLNLR